MEEQTFDYDSIEKSKKVGEGTYGIVYTAYVKSIPNNINDDINDDNIEDKEDILIKPRSRAKSDTSGASPEPQDVNSNNENNNEEDDSDEELNDYVKIAVKRNTIDKTTDFTGSVKELDMLKKLCGHPYIVSLLGVSFGDPFLGSKSGSGKCLSPLKDKKCKDDNVHFILEHAKYDLHDYIHEEGGSFKNLKRAMLHILIGIEYIHFNGIIHRDLKPGNVLVFDSNINTNANNNLKTDNDDYKTNLIFKICDFGLSKQYTNQGLQSPKMVTSLYRAPEICVGWKNYTNKVDMWSIGCIFFEMISGKLWTRSRGEKNSELFQTIYDTCPSEPTTEILNLLYKNQEWRHMSLNEQNKQNAAKFKSRRQKNAPKQKSRKSMKEHMSLSLNKIKEFNNTSGNYDSFINLLKNLLNLDPNQRYSATQALDHEFFNDYRKIIEESRLYLVRDEEEKLYVRSCKEREWAMALALKIYDERDDLVKHWYKERILFQSIDMFHRYLCYLDKNNPNYINEEETADFGQHLSRYDAEIQYLVCVYLCIKYFSALEMPITFKELTEIASKKKYSTEKTRVHSGKFEIVLIREILEMDIYHDTVYESADHINHILSQEDIENLLYILCNTDSYSSLTPKQLLIKYIQANSEINNNTGNNNTGNNKNNNGNKNNKITKTQKNNKSVATKSTKSTRKPIKI